MSFFIITLNRPKTYNALNLEDAKNITQQLESARNNHNIKFVLIRSSMDKVFCAGGDVKAAYYAKIDDNTSYLEDFFRTKYQLNDLISTYPKPIIAFINGLTLGGGMGISMHAKYRVVNEYATLGMPETTIGFFTDIGAGHFYKKLPMPLNLYYSLTGESLSHQQALHYELATHFVSTKTEADFFKKLEKCNSGQSLSSFFSTLLLPSPLSPSSSDFLASHSFKESEMMQELKDKDLHRNFEDDRMDVITTCFKNDSIEAIFERLQNYQSAFAQKTLDLLFKKSPTSLKVVFELIKRSQTLSLKEILEQDFILSQNFMNHPDCIEGIRAQVIDKDKSPQWNPTDLESVTDEMVARFFVAKPGIRGLFKNQ